MSSTGEAKSFSPRPSSADELDLIYIPGDNN